QHLRCRGLLLKRFGEIIGALTKFVEQARVLDGDDRLGGEVLHQLDLLIVERSNLPPPYRYDPNQILFPKEWNGKNGACAFVLENLRRETGLFGDICNVDSTAF